MAVTIKTQKEIESMRIGGQHLAQAILNTSKHVVPGISTKELDTIFESEIRKMGDDPAFLGYRPEGVKNPFPASLCTSINDVVVHGIPNENQILKEGDIITLDGGLVHNGLYTDHAITVAVGKVSKEALKLMEITQNSLMVGIKAIRPGARTGDIGSAIEKYVKPFKYGIVRELAGHGVGYTVHEDPYVPNYGKAGTGDLLKPGMIVAIEPMLTQGTRFVSFSRDGYTVTTKDHNLSAHFEHTVLITETGYEILTKV
jgi:methionyl aminopeptidase